jgi:acyl-CoA thioesterase-1
MLRGLDPAAAETALAEILTKARDAHIVTLLAGMKSIANFGPDYQRRFDAIYPDLAAKFGVALYPFFLEGVAGDPALTLPDGLHPNREGVERIVAAILPSVEAALTQAQTKP